MRSGRTADRRGTVRDSYLDLIRQLPLRPIRTKRELDSAINMIDSLLDKETLDSSEADYLDVLSGLVERHEEAEIDLGAGSDAEMLAHLLEARNVTQSEAARATRISNSTLSAIQSGKRKFTRDHIHRLAGYFNVPPAAFYHNA